MSEESKRIWEKSWTGWQGLLLWFILFLVAAFILSLPLGFATALFCAIGLASTGVILIVFIHWVSRWRNFKRFLFGLACLVTLIALFYAEEDWRGKHDWEQFKREWEAKGERFDRAGVVPPPVPDDQNFALTPIVATTYETLLDKSGHRIEPPNTNIVNRLEMAVCLNYEQLTNGTGNWQKSIGSDLKVWQQYYRALAATTDLFPIPLQPQSPAADVLLALSKYDKTIDELRQAGRLSDSRFPLEYDKEDPNAMVLPHLSSLKRCAQVLQLRALADLQSGQNDKALDDLKLLFRLTDSIHTEPILISHLVRAAMVNLALQPVWEGLMDHRWSDAQLSEFDQALARLNFLADYKLSLRGELVLCQGGAFDSLRHHPDKYANLFAEDYDSYLMSWWARIHLRLVPSGWLYQNQLRCARVMVEFFLPVADEKSATFSPAATRLADTVVAADVKHSGLFNRGENLFLPSLGNAARKFARGQCSVDLARVAIALERYRLGHGEYPESPDALAPQFIVKLPHNIINGQPLHYHRTSEGQFVLYSVGWNETDDGGEVGLTRNGNVDINTGDWVWRYPEK